MPGEGEGRQTASRHPVTLALAFDCAVTGLSAALVRGENCLARAALPGRDQAARLLPAIADLFDQAKVARRDVGLIAVTVGPGSFTGVRVGLATARGLALALGVPLAGIATTSVLLAQTPSDLVAIDSRLGDWFCATAEGDQAPFLASSQTLRERFKGKTVRIVGPEAETLAREMGGGALARQELPDAVTLARLALARGAEHWHALGMPGPLYLRGVNVTTPDGTRQTVE